MAAPGSFGRRPPSPASPQPPGERPRLSKRSQTVSLILLAGAGAAALALGHADPSQKEEDALVYRDDQECIAQGLRTAEDCTREFRAAQEAHPRTATRYADNATCERHHGPGGCTAGGAVSPSAAGAFVPVFAGYMIGRTLAQGLPVQPLSRHAPEEKEREPGGSSSGGGYCTSSGGRVWRSAGGTSSVARVSSAVARTTTGTPRVVASDGIGATGRSMAMASGHGGSAHAGG